MLEKPDIADQDIILRLNEAYGLSAVQLDFLPLGADVNTAVYRVMTGDGIAYFLKLRKGSFDPTAVTVPHFLSRQGIQQVIAPLETRSGQLWTCLGPYYMILSPFVEGQDGYGVALTERQWLDFGAALKGLHSANLLPECKQRIPVETYSPQWREMVKVFQAQVESETFEDPIAARMAADMRAKRATIQRCLTRAETLARALQTRSIEFVLCHADMHPGNLLLDKHDVLHIVDWDNLIYAPKERDLMFIGGWVGAIWNTQREAALFYQGYGQAAVDPIALAYYRYERLIQDIAAFCEQILGVKGGVDDREQGFKWFQSNFEPDGTIEMADRSHNM